MNTIYTMLPDACSAARSKRKISIHASWASWVQAISYNIISEVTYEIHENRSDPGELQATRIFFEGSSSAQVNKSEVWVKCDSGT